MTVLDTTNPGAAPSAARRVGLMLMLAIAACPAARGAPAASDGIVDAEQRFAAAVAADGIGPGFLAFLADSAVVLTPDPTPARPIYEALTDDGARLVWRADLASTSAAGDFGWTSGPWLHYAKEAPAADLAGHYFTVWRRSAADGWKVLLDGGVAYPVPAERRATHLDRPLRARAPHRGGGPRDGSCDQPYFADWQKKGRAHALGEYAARDVRLLATSAPPADGRDALGADPLRGSPLVAARVARRLSSTAGDLEVAYGEYEVGEHEQFGKRHYAFVLAFDAADHCRLALELLTPTTAAVTSP